MTTLLKHLLMWRNLAIIDRSLIVIRESMTTLLKHLLMWRTVHLASHYRQVFNCYNSVMLTLLYDIPDTFLYIILNRKYNKCINTDSCSDSFAVNYIIKLDVLIAEAIQVSLPRSHFLFSNVMICLKLDGWTSDWVVELLANKRLGNISEMSSYLKKGTRKIEFNDLALWQPYPKELNVDIEYGSSVKVGVKSLFWTGVAILRPPYTENSSVHTKQNRKRAVDSPIPVWLHCVINIVMALWKSPDRTMV